MNKLIISNTKIENMIYEIRGKQVMLDSDLASLYNVETKRINEAVRNKPQKFPERFSFKLTDEESKIFLVENFDQKNNIETRGGKYKNPRVFTEQGVAMLATILKSPVAIQTSINIMDAFVKMRRYLSNDLIELTYMKKQILNNSDNIDKNTEDIKLLQESFNKLNEKQKVSEIYFNGQIFDAYSKILDIFKSAKNNLVIIDASADNTLLDIIKRLNINVTIITKSNNLLTNQDIEKYNKQYNNLKVKYDNTFHDRYFILDKKRVYHCGTSINRIGYKTFSITLINDKDVCNALINKIVNIV